jgi:hypothetical protein
LEAVDAFADRDALRAWPQPSASAPETTHFAAGQFLPADDAHAIPGEIGLTRRFDYRAGLAYYDGQSGAVLGAFRTHPDLDGCMLLHVNSDPEGRYAVVVARKS